MTEEQQQDRLAGLNPVQRKIRSFVRRVSRITSGQQKALDDNWSFYGLHLDDGVIDPGALFERQAPVVLEIGFGNGKSLHEMIAKSPDKDFIGIEVHEPGVGGLLMAAAETDNKNLRVYIDDAVEILKHCIPDNSLDKVQLFFPDPWHKKRHHKRRIVQAGFMEMIHAKLKLGGVFHMATDWENYAQHAMKVLEAAPGFVNQMGDKQYSTRPDSRPVTKFEMRGHRLGHGTWDLLFEKQA